MESCGSIKSLSMPELLDRVAAIRAGVEAAQAEAERSLQRTSNEVVDKLAQATTQITAQQAGSLQSLSQETAAGFERLGKEIGEAVGRGHQESATLLRSIDAQIRETLSSMVDRTVKETAMRLDAARNTQAALLRETEASLTTIVSPQGERIERLEQTVTDLSQALEAAEAAAKSNHADVTDRVTQLKIEQSAALNRMKGQLVSLATLTILGLIVGFVALGAFLSQMFQSSTQPFR
jgi:tetrahydromethanopterin S-methyltransferase subunit B